MGKQIGPEDYTKREDPVKDYTKREDPVEDYTKREEKRRKPWLGLSSASPRTWTDERAVSSVFLGLQYLNTVRQLSAATTRA